MPRLTCCLEECRNCPFCPSSAGAAELYALQHYSTVLNLGTSSIIQHLKIRSHGRTKSRRRTQRTRTSALTAPLIPPAKKGDEKASSAGGVRTLELGHS